MRFIKYKNSRSNDFVDYVDIGYCERDYYMINFYLPQHKEDKSGKRYFKSYSDWFKNFKIEPIGSQMLILFFYLDEFMGWSWNSNRKEAQLDYFTEVYGAETASRISNNLDYLLGFINTWFDNQTSVFKGLDLNYDDLDYETKRLTEYGEIAEIELADGSFIILPDEDDQIRSFYVPHKEFGGLQKQINEIVKIFEP
jgi:hypothetical protein